MEVLQNHRRRHHQLLGSLHCSLRRFLARNPYHDPHHQGPLNHHRHHVVILQQKYCSRFFVSCLDSSTRRPCHWALKFCLLTFLSDSSIRRVFCHRSLLSYELSGGNIKLKLLVIHMLWAFVAGVFGFFPPVILCSVVLGIFPAVLSFWCFGAFRQFPYDLSFRFLSTSLFVLLFSFTFSGTPYQWHRLR